MVIVFIFCYTIVIFYELYIYCKIFLEFIQYTIILILKINSTGPYIFACPRALEIIDPALIPEGTRVLQPSSFLLCFHMTMQQKQQGL